MMSGRPLLVSSSDPLRRLVNSTSSGLVFEANNPQDFASKVLTLYNDRTLGNTLGANGRQATTEGNLNWDTEQLQLIHFYRSLFSE
jgi:glycosyltransferase involved in cell wall biosynthesis